MTLSGALLAEASGARARIAGGLVVLVFLVALGARWWALDRLPGLNADEAWLSTQVIEFLSGRNAAAVTPTDNPINPFHALSQALFETVHRTPSILKLRATSALCGVLLMVLAFPLLRTSIGTTRALCFSLLVWVLPQHVGYARFGWEPSQTPLVTLLCLAAALRGRTIWLAVLLFSSLWVHPTNVFLVPVLAGLLAGRQITGQRRLESRDLVWIALGLVSVAAFIILLSPNSLGPAEGPGRLLHPNVLVAQGAGVGRLISGATIVQYIVGPLPHTALLCVDAIFWGSVLLLAATGLPRLIRERDGVSLGLIAGVVASIGALTALGGLRPFVPGWERYAMFLTVPCCLILACLVARPPTSDRAISLDVGRTGVLAVVCLAWLAVFVLHYHVPLDARSSRSYPVFSTGPVEPKAAAFDDIASEEPEGQVLILTENYWTFWPMRYFAARDERIRVEMFHPAKLRASPAAGHQPGRATFAVGFAKGRLARTLDPQRQSLQASPPLSKRTYEDRAGEPILHVWRLR